MFELRSQCGHAVDDNNDIRSRAGDLALAWKSKTVSNKHMMACFATAEANALKYWNYLHPTSQLTKAAWRKALVPELLTAVRQQKNNDMNDRAPSRKARVPELLTSVRQQNNNDMKDGNDIVSSNDDQADVDEEDHALKVFPYKNGSEVYRIQKTCMMKGCKKRVTTHCACTPTRGMCRLHFGWHVNRLTTGGNRVRRKLVLKV